ncbi:MAG: RAMP superfamily CRISPR-associated protein [Spirulina sp.]
MPAILVTIKTLQPILATSFQGDPNSDVSYDYIPGSMIRGALIGRYLKQKGLNELNLDDLETQRLFFASHSTRYLNAYLVSKQEQHRTLPIPRSWYKRKDTEISKDTATNIYDRSLEYVDEEDSLKVIRGGFCVFEEGCIRLYAPERRINIHNTRDRRKGRSSKREDQPSSEGEIFRYDALDSGQTFQSVVLCEEQDVSWFEELLAEPDLWLGGSRSAGYGHTKLSYEIADDNWQETDAFLEEDDETEHLTIILLSDAILSDASGQPTANPHLLNVAINNACESALLSPEPKNIFSSSTFVGGFNRKWGLPLPQLPTLSAGTVVVFEDAELTDEQIQQLQWQGIGDRRNEGFGRVAVNWHRKANFNIQRPPQIRAREQKYTIGSTQLANFMAEQLLRQRLEQKLKKQLDVSKLKQDANGTIPISNSQLSRLRLAARQGLAIGSLQPIQDLLDEKNLTKTALKQFQASHFDRGNIPLYEQIKTWMSSPHSWLNLPDSDMEISLSGNINRSLNSGNADDPLLIEYTLRLIMAVAKQATKENQQ